MKPQPAWVLDHDRGQRVLRRRLDELLSRDDDDDAELVKAEIAFLSQRIAAADAANAGQPA